MAIKDIIHVVSFLLCISCLAKVPDRKKFSIVFDKSSYKDSCGAGFTFHGSSAKDITDSVLLKKYLYKCFVDNECEAPGDRLFVNPVFKKAILSIYYDSNFIMYSIYEDNERWREKYLNMLYYCTNDSVRLDICNQLLEIDEFDGVIGAWDNGINSLSEIDEFFERNSSNPYILLGILTAFHNNKSSKTGTVFERIKDLHPNFLNTAQLLVNQGNVSYVDFCEIVYGGM